MNHFPMDKRFADPMVELHRPRSPARAQAG
jgi:hypothetical protein